MNLIAYLLTSTPVASILGLLGLIVVSIIIYSLYLSNYRRKRDQSFVNTCVILGPGGHCKEMLTLLERVNFVSKYKPVTFIIGIEDKLSTEKLKNSNLPIDKSRIQFIRRSRHVGQSYFSSIFTTLISLFDSIKIMYNYKCDLLICNGPGTCIPPMIIAYLIHRPTIIFVESFCRVKSLSLSGRIAIYFADHVLVQWEELTKKYPKCKYIGLLV
ncbi:UDP-N-acetylglucosamine transferase subunit ALG14 homolog [Panonychus citri]|uniref:UDP-N-acetylglucosamine transferase subunit ALG14 homolog n=1 Tax=Panonychus citri TaxID=50023 RepID=UPI002307AAC4|nr:UDP-N-acetylglucosamine transferase subunit ALG14 homolog [Panonychus citri]XP_053203258.1 UDP-N-acetylglucosamine transferase subunit ALG14 homolog [Panonychus citri]